MKVVGEEPWSWMLYETDDASYLSVLCGGVAMYTVDFKLDDDERAQIAADGAAAASTIARAIQQSSTQFTARHIRDFNQMPGVESATKAWQAARRAKPST